MKDGLRTAVFGLGATGVRIARLLAVSARVSAVQVYDSDPVRLDAAIDSLGPAATSEGGGPVSPSGRSAPGGERGGVAVLTIDAEIAAGTDVVVVATPAGAQNSLARRALESGAAVVTTSDEIAETRDLLAADAQAHKQGVPLVVGAGYMPGLTCLLARLGSGEFDVVDEIHVSKVGTGGPACARQHHRALSSLAIDWRDDRWVRRAGGSGRELCWFPDPVAGQDCYRAALPDALLLVPAFPDVERVTARMAATRRDRLTSPLPMLRRPHPEGGVGAVRVELRGSVGGARRVIVLGSSGRPAEAAAVVAARTALHVATAGCEPGAYGLASITHPAGLLRSISTTGLGLSRFEGFALTG